MLTSAATSGRLFATIERIPKTVIDIGYVGVVVSYVGPKGEDLSGEDYSHGRRLRVYVVSVRRELRGPQVAKGSSRTHSNEAERR